MASPSDFQSASPDPQEPSSDSWSTMRDALPRVDLASRGPLPALPDLPAPAPPSVATSDDRENDLLESGECRAPEDGGSFWLNGDVLMCACPDCGAPMTVRLWLMIADCWRCDTSIELTEEQEREARRILEQQSAGHDPSSPPAAVISQAIPSQVAVIPSNVAQPQPDTGRASVTHQPLPPPQESPAELPQRRRMVRPVQRGPRVTSWLHDLLESMPAWLISLLFHVILLTVLGLLTSKEDNGPYITLSSRINRVVREGGDTRIVTPTDQSVFDLGVPESIDLQDPAIQRAVARADQDARELRLVEPDNPYLPDLTTVKQEIATQSHSSRSLATRDPRVRVEMVKREGGTTLTEAAVARGLRWLSRHQNADGSWSLDHFERAASCRCGDAGTIRSDSAGTSLALLPFLGAGQTHLTGIYKDTVAKGLRWLIQNQEADGDLRGSSGQYPGMYAQGQGAIVLCEAFLMTGDEDLRIPAQRAIDFIVEAQYPDGGWRYYPSKHTRAPQGDTSVFGWQLMALQSALAADLSVPAETLENASHFLDGVQRADGSLYAYLPREEQSAPMTAEGLLCRIYLGWKRSHPALRAGVAWMLENDPPSLDRPNIYYWYYATQTIHHFGGSQWDQWNLQMRDVLVATQETRGHAAGSWRPNGPLTSQGGRIYMTSLAVCCLEVYYRHLPLFRQIDLQ
jgi:hypothetical protein